MEDATEYVISSEINSKNVCLICLQVKISTVPISSILETEDSKYSSITCAELLTKLVAEPIVEYPQSICLGCVSELKSVYLFILKYEASIKVLKSIPTSDDIKAEIYVDESYDVADNFEEENIAKNTEPRYKIRNSNNKRIIKAKRKRKNTVKIKESSDSDIDSTSKFPLHVCPICTKEFTALDLRDHAQSHRALKKYLNIPQKVSPTIKFYTKRHLDNNSETLFSRNIILHKCPYCNEEYKVEDFRRHLDMHRRQDEFKCDKCDRIFRRLNHLNTHRVKHLKEFPYKCEDCGKGFVIKKNYDCHILTHREIELPHECKYCFKRFSNPEHLNRHQIIHTENVTYSVKYKVCRCHHCLKTFKDKDELKCHQCVPIGKATNGKFPCRSCKKVFKHSSGLYNHNRTIHKLKGAKTLCSVCGSYVSNIYNHMMRHTGQKPYQCNQCEKKFTAKPQLRQHLLVHSGLKPFVCSVCAKAFNNLYNLQVHERIHKGDRCHICSFCGKGFLEKSYLKKHMNIHSRSPKK